MIEKEPTYELINGYLKLRQKYLAKYLGGMLNSKKTCQEKWTEADERELHFLNARKRECEETIQKIKKGKKSQSLAYYTKKQKEKLEKMVKQCQKN